MKKFIAILTAMVMAFSLVCVSASASTEIELSDGVTVVMYDDGEIPPFMLTKSVSDFNFTISIPYYPSVAPIRDSKTNDRNILVESGKSVIVIDFDSHLKYRAYFSVYDATAGKYITDQDGNSNHLIGPTSMAQTFSINGLTSGHEYQINLSTTSSTGEKASGSVYTY